MSDTEEESNRGNMPAGLKEASYKKFKFVDKSDSASSIEENETVQIRCKLFQVENNNKCVFNEKYFFSEELLILILSYLEPQDLVFNCRLVCKNWCNMIDSSVWKLLLERNHFEVTKTHELKWVYYYWVLLKKNLFNRNLVKNSCGKEGFKHWEDLFRSWQIENPPVGCDDFPDDIDKEVLKHNSCFAATDQSYKAQNIFLNEEGATRRFMQIVKPKITFTDWYCGRFDGLCHYRVDVKFINKYFSTVDLDSPSYIPALKSHSPTSFSYSFGLSPSYRVTTDRIMCGARLTAWHKVSHDFENYSEKVEGIMIEHYGMCGERPEDFTKVTGTSIVFSIS